MTEERVERRLAAILAADVAGYSRLMGVDEAGTLARLQAMRRELIDPTIAEHQGPHRQDDRRRAAGRVPERRRGGRLRGGDAARHGRAQRRIPATSASSSASASIWAISSSMTATFTATASMSPRGSKASAEPGGICISDDAFTTRSAAKLDARV